MLDVKVLKKDLIYAIKTFQKDGKILKVQAENLEVIDGKYHLTSGEFDPLQALILIKGWSPLPEYLSYLASMERTSKSHEEFVKYIVAHQTLLFDCDQSRIDHLAKAPTVPSVDSSFGYTEWGYLLPLLERETGILSHDWYQLMNGFDFIAPPVKNEFYDLGVYLREKFLPTDARKEALAPSVFKADRSKITVIRKFAIQTRGKISIMEVEGEIIDAIEDPSIMTLPSKEYKFRVLSPKELFEKHPNGSLVSPIYCSHSLFESSDEAMVRTERYIRSDFDFEVRKGRLTAYTEEEVQAELAKVQVIKLR